MNRYFSKDGIQMSKEHMKRCSTLVLKEKQMKNQMKYHFTSIRIAIKKKKMVRIWRNWDPRASLVLPQNVKQRYHITQQLYFYVHTQEN